MIRLVDPEPSNATLEQGFSYIKKGDLGKAISVMDELIENDPYLAQAYWGRALCLEYRAENQDDLDKAISDYSKSIVYSDDASSLSFGRRGILYFKSGMLEDALQDLDQALESDLYWIEARFYRGRTYISLARSGEDARLAEQDFTSVISNVGEPFAPAHFWRAQARRILGKNSEAVSDYETALKIDPEDVLALNALAYCNEHGIGIAVNRTRAEELYARAAKLGFVVSQKNLAWFYGGESDGNDENAELSAYWMREAAEEGDPEAQNLYGLRLLHGKGVEQDSYRAVHYFKIAATGGYAPAICNLADCLEQGIGISKDENLAFKLYEKAAADDFPLAVYHVGRCYYFGVGVEENNDKAFSILKPVADSGHARAQDIIGMCYENGYGVSRDFKLAGKYFNRSYKQGYIHAGTHLASRYRAGRGVKKNLSAAVRLYSEAAEKGSSYARYLLGRLYFDDKFDYTKAVNCFRTAINDGEHHALIWLARSLLYSKNPCEYLDEVYSLLTQCINEQDSPLHAAIFLSSLELYGFCGYPLDQSAAINRLINLIPPNSDEQQGLSCAYSMLAQANELGLGIPRDTEAAVEYYLKSGHARETGGCRCFVAGFAHMLFQGIGCPENHGAAEIFIRSELAEFGNNTCSDIRLLYIWSALSSGENQDRSQLIGMTGELLLEDPHNASAAYMLWFLHKDTEKERLYMRRLKKTLEKASPYFRFMIERAIDENLDRPVYPLLTAGVVDSFLLAGE